MTHGDQSHKTHLGKWLPRDHDIKASELIIEDVEELHARGHLLYADGRRRRTRILLDTLERDWCQS